MVGCGYSKIILLLSSIATPILERNPRNTKIKKIIYFALFFDVSRCGVRTYGNPGPGPPYRKISICLYVAVSVDKKRQLKVPREGIEPSPFPTNHAMHSDQCFGLPAKQPTVYPPRDSTRAKVKHRGNACARTIYMGLDSQNACVSRVAPSPETLTLFNK